MNNNDKILSGEDKHHEGCGCGSDHKSCGCNHDKSQHKSCGCSSHVQNLSGCSHELKDEGCNDFDSVPVTYDSAESCYEHEKTAGNNQWCSTHK